MGGSFWLGVECSLRGRLRRGLDCTRLPQPLVLCIHLLKRMVLYVHSKSCFPLNFPLLVKHHKWKVVQCLQQPVHFHCACSTFSWSEFLVQMLQSFRFRGRSSMHHGLIKCETRRWFAFSLTSRNEKTVLGPSPVFPASISFFFSFFFFLELACRKKKSVVWEGNLLPIPAGLEEGG